MKKEIREEIIIQSGVSQYSDANLFLKELNELIEKANTFELKSRIILKFDYTTGYYDDDVEFNGVFLQYTRLETNEEYEIRKQKEDEKKKKDEENAIKSKKQQELNERKMYLKLKAKFENENK